ncbi:hypothetical protein KAR91_50635 [Candidatus Pacearchaeota archaeon]|nr:hypothetical protein [Candidatus Pacearchaeota archaeon]
MTERGVIYTRENRDKVRQGLKTMTRRVIVPQPIFQKTCPFGLVEDNAWLWRNYAWKNGQSPNMLNITSDARYQAGDLMYMREPYQISHYNVMQEPCGSFIGKYLDDNAPFAIPPTVAEFIKWNNRKKPHAKTSSMFMYKSLARTWFEVTGVRVERVQDISETDAIAEGFPGLISHDPPHVPAGIPKEHPIWWFQTLWDSINLKRGYGWEKSPWVFAYEFKLLKETKP